MEIKHFFQTFSFTPLTFSSETKKMRKELFTPKMPYFSRMSVTFFKNGLKWLGYMYIKGFGVELASYQNFKSNMVSGKWATIGGRKTTLASSMNIYSV